MIIKKIKNQAKLNALPEDFSFSIEGSPSFPHKPHTQTFLTLQSK